MLQQLRVAPGTLVVAAAWQAYAAELGATDLAAISRWGDVKYVGLVLLPPAWFAFAALFAGRGSWVNGRNLALLAIHPLVMLLLLANTATHDLVRWYPPGAAADPDAVAAPGPLFWPHLVYSGMVMWGSLVLDPLHRVVDATRRLSGSSASWWPTPSAGPWPSCCPRPPRRPATRTRAATGCPRSWC
jgi:hypothetical protein